MNIEFEAFDYNAEDRFVQTKYRFEGDVDSGWQIFRNGQPHLQLASGYHLLKTRLCGICSTDLDRRFLPFPLPQVIGHELIAESMDTGQPFAVEINDTSLARGEKNHDAFVREGIPTHSPDRQVLGIDRLPGGFAPYILAPKNAMIATDGLDDSVAVLTEPFAAALQAVIRTAPQNGEVVAVLGPRRLGSLVIVALDLYRKKYNLSYAIHALVRRPELIELARQLGADDVKIVSNQQEKLALHKSYDRVYDTSAAVDGFLDALNYAKKEVHLKTTNGQPMAGVEHLTELVVDELSILAFKDEHLQFHWPNETGQNTTIYIPTTDHGLTIPDQYQVYSGEYSGALAALQQDFPERVPRFDIGIACHPDEVAFLIRPQPNSEQSAIRPRRAILCNFSAINPLFDFIESGGVLSSSRCGDFSTAIALLGEYPDLAKRMSETLISHTLPAQQLPRAYQLAADRQAIKVVINHQL